MYRCCNVECGWEGKLEETYNLPHETTPMCPDCLGSVAFVHDINLNEKPSGDEDAYFICSGVDK